jgi:hypothetical protein
MPNPRANLLSIYAVALVLRTVAPLESPVSVSEPVAQSDESINTTRDPNLHAVHPFDCQCERSNPGVRGQYDNMHSTTTGVAVNGLKTQVVRRDN